MKCSICGAEIPDDAKFCPDCGFVVSDDDKNSSRPQEQQYEQETLYTNEFENEGQTTQQTERPDFGGAQQSTKVTYCSNCGHPLEPGLSFCRNCGVKADNDVAYTPKKVGFLEAYKLYWKNYFKFSGRASLGEYWFVVLWNILLSFVLGILMLVILGMLIGSVVAGDTVGAVAAVVGIIIVPILLILWGLINVIPDLALTVRRLHDSGKSGWWFFISFIPSVGWIILLVLLLQPSTPTKNQYDD